MGASAIDCTAASTITGVHEDLIASVGVRALCTTLFPTCGGLLGSRFHPRTWCGGVRLSAPVAPRANCYSASAQASSNQVAGGSGGGATRRMGGCTLTRRGSAASGMEATRSVQEQDETVGAAGTALLSTFAAAPTDSKGARTGGDKVGVVDPGLLADFASTPTLVMLAAVRMSPTRPGVVGVPDAFLGTISARTSTTQATMGRTAIGKERIGASDVFLLVPTSAEAPIPRAEAKSPMADGMLWAPCVAVLLTTASLETATHDDPMGRGRRMGDAGGEREMGRLGGRWIRTSMPRALATTCTTLNTLPVSIIALAPHGTHVDIACSILVTDWAEMAM